MGGLNGGRVAEGEGESVEVFRLDEGCSEFVLAWS